VIKVFYRISSLSLAFHPAVDFVDCSVLTQSVSQYKVFCNMYMLASQRSDNRFIFGSLESST